MKTKATSMFLIAAFIFFGIVFTALADCREGEPPPYSSPYSFSYDWTFFIEPYQESGYCRTRAIGLPLERLFRVETFLEEHSDPVLVRVMLEPANPGPPVMITQYVHRANTLYMNTGTYKAYLPGRYYAEVLSITNGNSHHSRGKLSFISEDYMGKRY